MPLGRDEGYLLLAHAEQREYDHSNRVALAIFSTECDSSRLGALTRDGVRVITADTVSITGAGRQQLGNDSQHPGVKLRRTRFSLSSSAARQGGCCSVRPVEQDRAGPAPEGQLER